MNRKSYLKNEGVRASHRASHGATNSLLNAGVSGEGGEGAAECARRLLTNHLMAQVQRIDDLGPDVSEECRRDRREAQSGAWLRGTPVRNLGGREGGAPESRRLWPSCSQSLASRHETDPKILGICRVPRARNRQRVLLLARMAGRQGCTRIGTMLNRACAVGQTDAVARRRVHKQAP